MATANGKSRARAVAAALALTLAAGPAMAAVELPARNPRASVSQDVGLTRITVEYASPAAEGRASAQLFAAAALRGRDDPAARISFSRDVVLAGKSVPAGQYALVLAPSAQAWTFTLYRDAERVEASRGAHPELEQARVTAAARPGTPRERLTFLFSDFTQDHASLDVEWGGARVSVPITVDTRAAILSQIRALDDVGTRHAAVARYLFESKKDVDGGLVFAKRAVALDDSPDNRALASRLEAAQARPARGEKKTEPAPTGAVAAVEHGASGGIALATLAPLGLDERRPTAGSPATRRTPGPTEIGPVVRKGSPDLEACYQRALRQNPDLPNARVTVSIAVGTSGKVQKVSFDGPSGLDDLERCVRTAVSRWAFPASSAAYQAEVPLALRAER